MGVLDLQNLALMSLKNAPIDTAKGLRLACYPCCHPVGNVAYLRHTKNE